MITDHLTGPLYFPTSPSQFTLHPSSLDSFAVHFYFRSNWRTWVAGYFRAYLTEKGKKKESVNSANLLLSSPWYERQECNSTATDNMCLSRVVCISFDGLPRSPTARFFSFSMPDSWFNRLKQLAKLISRPWWFTATLDLVYILPTNKACPATLCGRYKPGGTICQS